MKILLQSVIIIWLFVGVSYGQVCYNGSCTYPFGRVIATQLCQVDGTPCSVQFSSVTIVTLTAIPNDGCIFMGWSGDCQGLQLTCTLTMNRDMNVKAVFMKRPVKPIWRR